MKSYEFLEILILQIDAIEAAIWALYAGLVSIPVTLAALWRVFR